MIADAFKTSIANHADQIVEVILVLVAGFVADELFRKSFIEIVTAIFGEAAKIADRESKISSLNLIGGIIGIGILVLYIVGSDAVHLIMRIFSDALPPGEAFSIFAFAALLGWGYFLLSIIACGYFGRQP